MDSAKIKEVFSDKEFVADLFATEAAADVQGKLASKGIELTNDEVVLLGMEISKYAEGEKQLPNNIDELSDAELSDVAGGIDLATVAMAYTLVAAAGIAGIAGGIVGFKAIDKKTNGNW